MSEEENNEVEETEAAAPAAGQAPGTPAAPQQELLVNDVEAHAGYANFCRVSSTPEELILDLGLNPTPYATGKVEVKVNQRIILNHFTAKRLYGALFQALQMHERNFGVVEVDVRKRVRTPPVEAPAGSIWGLI